MNKAMQLRQQETEIILNSQLVTLGSLMAEALHDLKYDVTYNTEAMAPYDVSQLVWFLESEGFETALDGDILTVSWHGYYTDLRK